jgi:hypothetical protein
MKTCIYCELDKPDELFDLEHIWPCALGGNALPDLWRTDDACKKCNNTAGLFVDGSFIKSWLGSAERWVGARQYISPDRPAAAILPLKYEGVFAEAPYNNYPDKPLASPIANKGHALCNAQPALGSVGRTGPSSKMTAHAALRLRAGQFCSAQDF